MNLFVQMQGPQVSPLAMILMPPVIPMVKPVPPAQPRNPPMGSVTPTGPPPLRGAVGHTLPSVRPAHWIAMVVGCPQGCPRPLGPRPQAGAMNATKEGLERKKKGKQIVEGQVGEQAN